jgi:hypothetical protein
MDFRYLCLTQNCEERNMRKTKKQGRGRPATGHDPTITIRLPVALRREIDRLAQKEGVTRSEMFRMLLERGMKASR